MKKVALYTLGCRVNQYETEAMSELFIKNGYEVAAFDHYADVYVINTCTVTNVGDKKSRQMIRKAKKTNPNAVVVVAGCYAQVSPDEVAKIEGVDVIIGTSNKSKIVELTEEYIKNNKQIVNINNIMDVREFENLEISEYLDKTRAFLKIQDGCDRYCAYCLIPFARGPVRSKKPGDIIDEVERLSKNGFKEVILSGIHVASYGKDFKDVNLVNVIEEIDKIDGIERIRIGSVDPTFFKPGIIERLSKIKKFCPHFHLSLQSGCDETLKRMNRHYTADEFRTIVNMIREFFEGASITTDLIVGFPGETDEEFNKTVQFIKEIELAKIHVFKYSPRKGTRAEKFENQVEPSVKDERSSVVIDIDLELENKFINKFVGKVMDVLFEEYEDGKAKGYTKNYIRVIVETDIDVKDQILDVEILGVKDGIAYGKLNN